MSFFRYPGGKSKLSKQLCTNLHAQLRNQIGEYREPFFGGGNLLNFLLVECDSIPKIWINDKDRAIADLWTSVIRYPKQLQNKVTKFVPSTDLFYKFKEKLVTMQDHPDTQRSTVHYGFMKLAIHQMSYSGLGTKSGGPLGGHDQKSTYKIDCRWSPLYINQQIKEHHNLFSQFTIHEDRCTSHDFQELMKPNKRYAFIAYLDPPYYVKGNGLYQQSFSKADHERLAACLKKVKFPWTLSYDDCPRVRSLYGDWAIIEELDVTYSIVTKGSSPDKVELMIHNNMRRKKKEVRRLV